MEYFSYAYSQSEEFEQPQTPELEDPYESIEPEEPPNYLQVPTPEYDDNASVVSEELFQMGTDNIMLEGEIMKFKPGLSNNFVSRYV